MTTKKTPPLLDGNEITSIVGWPDRLQMEKFRAVVAAAERKAASPPIQIEHLITELRVMLAHAMGEITAREAAAKLGLTVGQFIVARNLQSALGAA